MKSLATDSNFDETEHKMMLAYAIGSIMSTAAVMVRTGAPPEVVSQVLDAMCAMDATFNHAMQVCLANEWLQLPQEEVH